MPASAGGAPELGVFRKRRGTAIAAVRSRDSRKKGGNATVKERANVVITQLGTLVHTPGFCQTRCVRGN